MESDTATLMLRFIPARLKGKIKRRVEQEGTNMNDVLVKLLADAYGVKFEGTGVRRLRIGTSSQINLKVPAELKDLLERDAYAKRETERNLAVEIICEEFDVPFARTGRWLGRAAA